MTTAANTTTDRTPITQRAAGDSAVTVLTTGTGSSSRPIYVSSSPISPAPGPWLRGGHHLDSTLARVIGVDAFDHSPREGGTFSSLPLASRLHSTACLGFAAASRGASDSSNASERPSARLFRKRILVRVRSRMSGADAPRWRVRHAYLGGRPVGRCHRSKDTRRMHPDRRPLVRRATLHSPLCALQSHVSKG